MLTLIWRADGLAEVLAALAAEFGGIAVLPVHPRAGAPAIRVLVRAVQGQPRAARAIPGLSSTTRDGSPTAAAEAVLRGGETLTLTET